MAINTAIVRAVVSVIVLMVSIVQAYAAVSPWCSEQGDPNYPLAFEAMAQGALLSPEVRHNPVKAVQAIRNVYEQQETALILSGRAAANDPDAQAFRRILQAQISGENRKSDFQFSTDPASGNARLIWPGEGRQVVFDCASETPTKLMATNPQKANIGYAANLVFTVLGEQLQAFDTYYSAQVSKRADEYMRYMTNGLPMWPWELAINGWGQDYHDLFAAAPRWQWVVVRPSAGLELSWASRRQAKLEASLAVEPIGFVRYTDTSYKNWWGLSTLVTLGTDNNGAGLGGLIRYNNYALGFVRRENIDDTYVFFSFDLYDKVRDTQTRAAEAKHELENLKQAWRPQ